LICEWRRPENDVFQRLGHDAADTQHHSRSELCVDEHADDEFPNTRDHLCDEEMHLSILWSCCAE